MFQFWTQVTVFVILGCCCIAALNVVKRYALKDKQISPLQFLVTGFGAATVLFGVVYISLYGFDFPDVLPGFWTAVLCGSLANVVIQFLNAKAASVDAGEVSLTAPLQAMTPGLITLLAITLGEFPGKLGIAGVGCMAAGSYVLLAKEKKDASGRVVGYHYFTPFARLKALFRPHGLSPAEHGQAIVVSMALGSAAMGTIGLLFDGLYTRRGVDLQGLTLAVMTLTGILTVTYLGIYAIWPDTTLEQRARGIFAARGERVIVFCILLFAVAWIAHIFLIQPTFQKAFVAYVGTLKRFSILISVVAGYLIFQEGDVKRRLWAAVLVVIGAVLISMDGLPARVSDRFETIGF